LINRIFGIDATVRAMTRECPPLTELAVDQSVEHWKLGETEIERELTSAENRFLVLHDSNGFEPGSYKTFDVVNRFIKQRRNESRPLKDQLHAIW
jgi:hypothetical protein